ncbi:sulfatase-like hydrolase/transferase, partial [Streptomyces scabiei]
MYHKLGFDNMIFSSGSKQHFIDESKVGVNMSDDSLYKNVLLKINPKESQFFSVITMQNHAPWSVRHPENITASGKGFSEI